LFPDVKKAYCKDGYISGGGGRRGAGRKTFGKGNLMFLKKFQTFEV
jgi:hypothetical protein